MTAFITIEKSQFPLYSAFLLLAFITGFMVFLREGLRRNYDLNHLLLSITFIFISFILGTQLIKFNLSDWTNFFRLAPITHNVGRSVLGGLILAVLSMTVVVRYFKFKLDFIDIFAFIIPIGMTIQRLGCLAAGCCYGTVTSLPFGIEYSSEFKVFQHHGHLQLIPESALSSLPVHPIAVYEIIGCLLIILTLSALKSRIKTNGHLLITSLSLYGVLRFMTEFVRDHDGLYSSPISINYIQIAIVVGFIALAFSLTRRKGAAIKKPETGYRSLTIKREVVFLVSIIVLHIISFRYQERIEQNIIQLVLIPAIIAVGWRLYRSVTVKNLRMASVAIILLSLTLMSQTTTTISKSDSTKTSHTYIAFGGGINAGNFKLVDYNGTDCNGNQAQITDEIDYQVTTFGLGVARQEIKGDKSVQFGANVYIGEHHEDYFSTNGDKTTIFDVNPFIQWDTKSVGFGTGFHLGNFTQHQLPKVDYASSSVTRSTYRVMNFFPSLYLRLGELQNAFFEARVASQTFTPFPAATYQANLGVGLKKMPGSAIRFGVGSNVGIIVGPTLNFKGKVILEQTIGLFPGLLTGKSSDATYEEIRQGDTFLTSVSVKIRIDKK